MKRIEIQVFKLIQTKYHGISVNKEIFPRGYKIHVIFDQSLNGFTAVALFSRKDSSAWKKCSNRFSGS